MPPKPKLDFELSISFNGDKFSDVWIRTKAGLIKKYNLFEIKCFTERNCKQLFD